MSSTGAPKGNAPTERVIRTLKEGAGSGGLTQEQPGDHRMSPRPLDTLVAAARDRLGPSPTADVPPILRLQIYDALAPGADLTERVRARERSFPPQSAPGYCHLVVATAERVLPIWDRAFENVHTGEPELEELRYFPHILVREAAAIAAGQREPRQEIEELGDLEPYLVLGGLEFGFHANAVFVADAAYHAWHALLGYLPFAPRPQEVDLDQATDRDLYGHDGGNYDVAWRAANAASVIDENPVGPEVVTPLRFDLAARRAFWEWWLAEVLRIGSREGTDFGRD